MKQTFFLNMFRSNEGAGQSLNTHIFVRMYNNVHIHFK